MADNVFGHLLPSTPPANVPSGPPVAPGVIVGKPKPVDPYKVDDEARKAEKARQDRLEWEATHNPDGSPRLTPAQAAEQGKSTADQTRVSTLLSRIKGGFSDIEAVTAKNSEAQEPGLIETMRGGLTPDGLLGVPARSIAGAERRTVHDSQVDVLDALLTLGTGAAYNKEQLYGQMVSYFPQYNDTPGEITIKNQRLKRLIEAAKVNAGPKWGEVEQAIAPYMSKLEAEPATGGAPTITKEQSLAIWGRALVDEKGNPLGPDGGVAVDPATGEKSLVGSVTDTSEPDARAAEIDTEIARRAKEEPFATDVGLGHLLVQGGSFGMSDEIMGGAESVMRGLTGDSKGYDFERDLYRRQLETARQENGALGTAVEFGGALMSGKPNALLAAPSSLRGALSQGAKIGAGTGAAAGFGYGSGAEESTTNALIGAGAGAPLGAAVSALGPGINALRSRMPGRAAADLGVTMEGGAPATAADIAAAGQAEGVTVRRAMVDPASRNKTAAVERTISGGPRIQGGLSETRREIEAGAQKLGQGGTAQTSEGAGQTIADAAQRYIQNSSKFFDSRYGAIRQAAGGVKVAPVNAGKAIDDIITGLSETPQMNAAEISYLQKIKSDFSKDLSIDALRKARTKLRKDIAKGDLTFGDSEADVLAVMNAASDDITAGLTNAGKANVAKRFAETDKLYRDRMEFIGGTIQKLIGRRNANLPPDQIIKNFRALPKRDVNGLGRFMDEMTPEERADIAATFADGLGKTNNNEFSVSDFIKHAEDIPVAARRAIWGDAGEQSIKNLVLLSKAHKAVPRGGSPTGPAQDYRGWLAEKLFGAGIGGSIGGYAGGDFKSAAAGAAAGGALASVGAARNILSARALMSPKISHWLRTAPATSQPAAINAHFQKLGAIAAQEPALAGDIQSIQKAIMDAARNSPGKLAAEDQPKGDRQKVPNAGREPPQQ